ncbi:MAG: hypothetical protein ABW094_03575 [Candidatus Thiodiazotropha sp.]
MFKDKGRQFCFQTAFGSPGLARLRLGCGAGVGCSGVLRFLVLGGGVTVMHSNWLEFRAVYQLADSSTPSTLLIVCLSLIISTASAITRSPGFLNPLRKISVLLKFIECPVSIACTAIAERFTIFSYCCRFFGT